MSAGIIRMGRGRAEQLEQRCLLAATLGVNLLVNGDAERSAGSNSGSVVTVPYWSETGDFTQVKYGATGSFPAGSDHIPPDSGNNFFAGGPSPATCSAYQIVDVSALATGIDRGAIQSLFSGWLGGFADQDDAMMVKATFRGASKQSLGTQQIGPVTSTSRSDDTGLWSRSSTKTVPTGTRSIKVEMTATHVTGSYNDAYADNLSLLLRGNSVSGLIYSDANDDGNRDTGENPLKGRRVYLDADNDSVFDAAERSALTDSLGRFEIVNVKPGTYRLRQILPAGWRLNAPSSGYHSISISAGETIVDRNFCDCRKSRIGGTVFNDANNNRTRDSGEGGFSSRTVYIDKDNDGVFDSDESYVTSSTTGNWQFKNLSAGSYIVRIKPKTGYAVTTPTTARFSVAVGEGQIIGDKLFGVRKTT